MKKPMKDIVFFVLMIGAIILFTMIFNPLGGANKPEKITYSDFITKATAGEYKSVFLRDKDLYGLKAGSKIETKDLPGKYEFQTRIISEDGFDADIKAINNALEKAGKPLLGYEGGAPSDSGMWVQLLITFGIGAVVLFFMFRMIKKSNGGAMNFGKSTAHLYTRNEHKVTFDMVAGADEEKEELSEVVEFLKNPQKFLKLGARIPKGILLVGLPGTGKTLLAKAVAGEAGVPFFSISGSDFVEMFVGVGASRVRDMFEQAKRNAPCILFIDEIDAVGRHRGSGLGGGHDEREQTLNQLLVEMDGFSVNEGIIMLAATNRSDILDPALLRPGRFDRTITVHIPDVKGREDIFKVHSKNKPLGDDIDLKTLAKLTTGFTGADIENTLNEAALLAARRNKTIITMPEIREAVIRVVAGPEKRSRVITEKDRKITAYHEAGHALVAKSLPNCDPVSEISIIPRGEAAGYTITLPEEDNRHVTRNQLLERTAMCLAGRAAEEIIFEDISGGAAHDLQTASAIVRKMITELGMSDEIGPVFLGEHKEMFIGRDFGVKHPYSDAVAAQIDAVMKKILLTAYDRAKTILNERMNILHSVSAALLEREKLTQDEFNLLFEGKSLEPLKG